MLILMAFVQRIAITVVITTTLTIRTRLLVFVAQKVNDYFLFFNLFQVYHALYGRLLILQIHMRRAVAPPTVDNLPLRAAACLL